MRLTLNYLQYRVAQMAGVSEAQASRIIQEVAKGLVKRSRDYIKWPRPDEMRQLADENNEAFGLPNTPLGVDGEINAFTFVLTIRQVSCSIEHYIFL